ncbi:MAG: hypothetical protein JXB10_05920 [Pirellulales bacterium]|nr:hypothetical protein [Pirellulales bacterium]
MKKTLAVVSMMTVACLLIAAWVAAQPGTGTNSGTTQPGMNTQGTNNNSSTNAAYYSRPNVAAWQNSTQSVRSNWQQYWNNSNEPKPFTPAWYAKHPQVWKVTHPYAQTGTTVTYANLASWLGLTSTTAPEPVSYEGYSETMIYATEDGATLTSTETGVYVNNSNQQQQAQQAALLASQGNTVENNAQWLSLGVYGLVVSGQAQSNVTMQLNVSKNGTIRGTYYDLLSDTTQTVKGSVDKQNQRAAWSITTNPTVVFETTLNNLTENTAPVNVYYGNTQTQKMTLVPMNGATTGTTNGNTSNID